jgi:Tfp pilus assembly protein PilF
VPAALFVNSRIYVTYRPNTVGGLLAQPLVKRTEVIRGEAVMKSRKSKVVVACTLLLVSVQSSDAQMRDLRAADGHACSALFGVVSQGPGSASGVSIEVRGRFDITQAHSSPIANGAFDFTCVAVGDYTLRVIDIKGNTIHSEQIEVSGQMNSVHVLLSSTQAERPASQWISVRQLQRKTDKKAERELGKAHAAVERGAYSEAVEHSRKALARDPEYPQAWLELGYVYARISQYEDAAAHFTRAADLDPEYLPAQRNLALAMLQLKRYDAAEAAARQALKLARPLPEMDFTLGVSLGWQRRNIDEAIQHLDRAAASHPRARLAAVRFLAEAGRRKEAVTRLEQYLRVLGDSPDRKDLESLLAYLK